MIKFISVYIKCGDFFLISKGIFKWKINIKNECFTFENISDLYYMVFYLDRHRKYNGQMHEKKERESSSTVYFLS